MKPNRIKKSLLVVIMILILSHSSSIQKLKHKNCQQILEKTWIYNFDGFLFISPLKEQYMQNIQLQNPQKQIINNILGIYPRNYQTLFIISLSGYGLGELKAVIQKEQQENLQKYIILKSSLSEYRWVRKNMYLNKKENFVDIFHIKLGNCSQINKSSYIDSWVSKFIPREISDANSQLTVEASLLDFVGYYFHNRLQNPKRIKNLAIIVEIDTLNQFLSFFQQIQQIVLNFQVKIQTTILISKKWKKRQQNIHIKILSLLKKSSHKVKIIQINDKNIQYSLQNNHEKEVEQVKSGDIFMYSLQIA